jgi:hypothetical protein
MTRSQLEHILRASGAITDENEIVILGSQSILGRFPCPPEPLCRSIEADAFPLHAPDKTDLIDGTIGELSPFHETHGYYAHGITPETTVLADGWQGRLVPLQTPMTHGVVGLCLAPVDLAISKLAASREKDLAFVRVMAEHNLFDRAEFDALIRTLPETARETINHALQVLKLGNDC